jgi:hypothetical protein
MKQSQIQRLVRKLIVLSILVVCLGAFNFGYAGKKPMIQPCCSQCDPDFEACVTSCGDPASGACLTFCNGKYDRCQRICIPDC